MLYVGYEAWGLDPKLGGGEATSVICVIVGILMLVGGIRILNDARGD